MDFPSYQAEARSSTAKLVALGLFGLLGIIAATSALTLAVIGATFNEFRPWLALAIGAPLTIATVLSIALGKSYLIRGGGGAYVARSLGGRQVDFTTLDARDKQLVNVVEEIAIASGTPAPALFVLDAEPGINAFAAGWNIDSSALGVTRGALEHLSRNELQGVLAHEFAHIINGDTRAKTRLIAWVFGITAIYGIGRLTFDAALRARHPIPAIGMMGIGMGLCAIGFVGSVFAGIIQAAVSRQREYLADASAVQYTRDPHGIGEALKKTGGLAEHGFLVATFGSETNHLFFASAFGGLLATHPPLKSRIKRLMPEWDGNYTVPPEVVSGPTPKLTIGPFGDLIPTGGTLPGGEAISGIPVWPVILTEGVAAGRRAGGAGRRRVGIATFQAPSLDGPTAEHIAYARELIASIPEDTRAYLHTRVGAVASVVGLLVSQDGPTRADQLRVAASMTGFEANYLDQAGDVIGRLGRPLQLPAIDMALYAIRETDEPFRRELAKTIRLIGESRPDQDLFRWMLRRVLLRHIDDQYDDGSVVHRIRFDSLHVEAVVVFAVVSWFNSSGPEDAAHAFRAALAAAHLPTVDLPALENLDTPRVDRALDALAQLDETGRRRFVLGATAAVLHDDEATADEAELIRVVADAVRMPVPPLLPT